MDTKNLEKARYTAEITTGTFDASSSGRDDSVAASQFLSGIKLVSVVLSLALWTFLVAIDISIVAVAIPRISIHLQALDQICWYGSAYVLTVTALQPATGKLCKFFDTKPMFLMSIAIFECES